MREMSREAIHALRKREHLAQAVFACYSHVSKSWSPTGSAAHASLTVRPCDAYQSPTATSHAPLVCTLVWAGCVTTSTHRCRIASGVMPLSIRSAADRASHTGKPCRASAAILLLRRIPSLLCGSFQRQCQPMLGVPAMSRPASPSAGPGESFLWPAAK